MTEARDGEEGAGRTLEDRPDVIVANFRMPRMDTEGMARAIRDDGREPIAPIVGITSLDLKAERKKDLIARKLFRVILRKPVDPRRLLDAIRAPIAETSGSG